MIKSYVLAYRKRPNNIITHITNHLRLSLFLLALAALLPACRARPLGNPADLSTLDFGRYPAAYRIVHRGHLQSPAGELVFTAVLVVKPTQAQYAVLDDLGVKLFEISWTHRQPQVLHHLPQMSQPSILRGPAQDLALIYLSRPPENFDLQPHDHGLRLTYDDPTLGQVTCDFRPPPPSPDHRWTQARASRPWHLPSTATLSDWGRIANWPYDIPRHIEIRHSDYRVTWDVIDLQPIQETPAKETPQRRPND